MKKPSPELLDLFYRACAFPIDDLDVGTVVRHTSTVMASAWFIPTRTLPAIFFVMGGGSGDLSALIFELRRLATMTDALANAVNWKESSRTIQRGLCYHYFFQVTHLDARVYSKSIEPWDDSLTPLLHAAPLHPWFDPMEKYASVYQYGVINETYLPLSTMDDTDAEFLGDPDAVVAKRIQRTPTPAVPEPRYSRPAAATAPAVARLSQPVEPPQNLEEYDEDEDAAYEDDEYDGVEGDDGFTEAERAILEQPDDEL